jgi:hypothetical protein
MPSWNDIFHEINQNPYDVVRRKYLRDLFQKTDRNMIAYYSAFLTKNGPGLSLDDADMAGFMSTVHGMDRTKGLDLILHTPGGNPTAAEALVKYLHSMFEDDVRVIVPQLAMSAGTMIACSGKEIVMGKQSSLGPIDPQINGMAAFNIRKVFDDAKADLQTSPQNTQYWALQLSKYPSSLVYDCINAIDLSSELVRGWLKNGMFKDSPDSEKTIDKIIAHLNQNEMSKNHGRHFDKDTCKSIGLKIVDIEEDQDFQDAVLSIHHVYLLLLSNTNIVKIIENQNEKAFIQQQSPQIVPQIPIQVQQNEVNEKEK